MKTQAINSIEWLSYLFAFNVKYYVLLVKIVKIIG